MDSHELLTLIDQVEFRLEMGKAVGSEQPLPKRVLQRVLEQSEFRALYEEASKSASHESMDSQASLPSSQAPTPDKRKIYQVLAADDRMKHLLFESIQLYNQRISVLAGLRSYLETAASKLWGQATSAGSSHSGTVGSASSFFSSARRHTNPLVQLALGTLFGTLTIVPSAYVVHILVVKNAPSQSDSDRAKSPASPAKTVSSSKGALDPSEDEARIQGEVARRLNEIVDAASKLIPKEIGSGEGGCTRCPAPPTSLNGTLTLKFPTETPELKISAVGPFVSLFPPGSSKNSPMPTDFNLNLHLSGIPPTQSVPSDFTLRLPDTLKLTNTQVPV